MNRKDARLIALEYSADAIQAAMSNDRRLDTYDEQDLRLIHSAMRSILARLDRERRGTTLKADLVTLRAAAATRGTAAAGGTDG